MIVIFLKAKNQQQVNDVVKGVLEARLANSIDQMPVLKSYNWHEGEIREREETLLLIKTKALLYGQIEAVVKKQMNTENPKMYSLPMTQVDDKYRDWLRRGVVEV